MIPVRPLVGTQTIPDGATFWMPKAADLDEEGLGFFRDVWLIKDVPVREARLLLAAERRAAEVVRDLAKTADDFERLARVVEQGFVTNDPDDEYLVTEDERAALGDMVQDDEETSSVLDGLELGVAGLVYALAAVRIIPAASCRSHEDARSWSELPVVLFAVTEYRAMALEPLVAATGCAFGADNTRPDLLAICAPSIVEMMDLAEAVVAARGSFVKPRVGGPAPRVPTTRPDSLF